MDIGPDKIIKFIKNSIDDFDQKMAFLVLWSWGMETWNTEWHRETGRPVSGLGTHREWGT